MTHGAAVGEKDVTGSQGSKQGSRPGLARAEIDAALRRLGIRGGDVIVPHTSIKAIGWVEEGPAAVADALQEAVGRRGTLAVPTFTLNRPNEPPPVIDPATDPCDVGSINAAFIGRPGVRRTAAWHHSFAVVGDAQDALCGIPPETSPLGGEGIFAKLLDLDARILLMGVAYTHCTAGHFAECLCRVPYRRMVALPAWLRLPDGALRETRFDMYVPRTDVPYPPRDFNRAGDLLEQAGKVTITTLGNAYLRLFRLRDWLDLILEHYQGGDNPLTYGPGRNAGTRLRDGYTVEETNPVHTVRSVVRPPAGRA